MIQGISSSPKVPTLASGNTDPPCSSSNKRCEYEEFQHSPQTYGTIGNVGNVTIPPSTPDNDQAMLVSNVKLPNVIPFNMTCP